MLKVLIVDDETPIREWIKFCIQKSPVSYEVIGLASNGQEALELFNEKSPDIIFTDIKMPLLDGMQLLQKVKKSKPSTEIIILTCHSDFEYARQAVKFGAKEYILKTEINEKIIFELLERASKSISDNYSRSDEELNSIHLKMEAFMRNFIFQKESRAALTEKELRSYNIPLNDTFIFSMALRFPSGIFKEFTENFEIPKKDNIENIFGFTFDKDIFVLVGNITGTPSTLLQINKTYDFALALKKANRCTIGLSNVYNGLKNLSSSIEEAVNQLKVAFYSGEETINRISTIHDKTETTEQLEQKLQIVMEEVRQKGAGCLIEGLTEWFAFAEKNYILCIESIKNLCIRILEFTLEYTKGGKDSTGYIQKVKEDIANINLFAKLRQYIVLQVNQLISSSNREEQNYSYSVSKAVRYIREHYAEQLSLTQVASYVSLNTDYFCRRFKEETGSNFSNYLTRIRLEKARELLKTTNKKVYEVAECVGYENLSYFSTIFKKHYCINPFDFRNGHDE